MEGWKTNRHLLVFGWSLRDFSSFSLHFITGQMLRATLLRRRLTVAYSVQNRWE
jgi:hypothetical protein